MTISFYKVSNTIYCRMRDKGVMVRMSTGIKAPELLTISRNRFVGPMAYKYNATLEKQAAVIRGLYEECLDINAIKDKYKTPETEEENYNFDKLCQKYITDIKVGNIKTKQKHHFRPSSISAYAFAIDSYAKFCLVHGSIDLMKMSLDNKDLKAKKILADKFNLHFDKFVSHMKNVEYKLNTRVNVVNMLSIVLNHYRDELFLQLPKMSKLSSQDAPIIVLDGDFLKRFVMDDHGLYKTFNANNKFMWEMAATMLVTSFRISDAASLKASDMMVKGKEVFLVKENQKTGEDTTMPLPEKYTDVIMHNLSVYQSVYTPIGAPEPQAFFRKHIKEFFKQYPEMQEEVAVRKVDINGDKVAESRPMYEWVHPHMLRKTAITTMLANDVSPEHVKFASGHKPMSNSFNRYVGFVDRHYKSQITDYHKKMFG
jgi:integrase